MLNIKGCFYIYETISLTITEQAQEDVFPLIVELSIDGKVLQPMEE